MTVMRVRTTSGWVDLPPQGVDGPTGPAGAAGEKWFTGSGAPTGATGAVGDWYVNSANGDFYEKTATSTWTLRGNLRGPAGADGIDGGSEVYEQPGTPSSPGIGAVWIDTDAPNPTSPPATLLTSGTTFPSSPSEGDVHHYPHAQGVWQFVRISGVWQFVGGPPLVGYAAVQRSISPTGTAYTAPPTDPLAVTVPLAGDFDVEVGVVGLAPSGLNSNYFGYSIGGSMSVAASDAWAAQVGFVVLYSGVRFEYRQTGLAASAQLLERWRTSVSGGGTVTAEKRRIAIRPVKLT